MHPYPATKADWVMSAAAFAVEMAVAAAVVWRQFFRVPRRRT